MTELINTLKNKASVARNAAQEKRKDAYILEGLARGYDESVLDIQKSNGAAMPKKKRKAKVKAKP